MLVSLFVLVCGSRQQVLGNFFVLPLAEELFLQLFTGKYAHVECRVSSFPKGIDLIFGEGRTLVSWMA